MAKKKLQLTKRTETTALPEPYEEFEITYWVNPPSKMWQELLDTDSEARRQELLGQVMIGHNGWCDYDGNELPPPNEARFWEEIPTELAVAVLAALNVAMGKLARSVRASARS